MVSSALGQNHVLIKKKFKKSLKEEALMHIPLILRETRNENKNSLISVSNFHRAKHDAATSSDS